MQENVNTKLDYILAICVILEAAVLYSLLTGKVSLIGFALPVIVAIVSTTITVLAFRSFFKSKR